MNKQRGNISAKTNQYHQIGNKLGEKWLNTWGIPTVLLWTGGRKTSLSWPTLRSWTSSLSKLLPRLEEVCCSVLCTLFRSDSEVGGFREVTGRFFISKWSTAAELPFSLLFFVWFTECWFLWWELAESGPSWLEELLELPSLWWLSVFASWDKLSYLDLIQHLTNNLIKMQMKKTTINNAVNTKEHILDKLSHFFVLQNQILDLCKTSCYISFTECCSLDNQSENMLLSNHDACISDILGPSSPMTPPFLSPINHTLHYCSI